MPPNNVGHDPQGGDAHPGQKVAAKDSTPAGRTTTSYSACLDNLVDGMYGRHAQHAQPLPSGSKSSVSWSPVRSLSICTDSGMSADVSRTPCSHARRVPGGNRHAITGGYRQVCAADERIASRLQPPGGSAAAAWQPLSGSHPPSRCLHTADSNLMLSPLGVCALQSCIPGRQLQVLQHSPRYLFM